ncbi:uncharacterized protein E0L32_003587 [Thyridium curvatum]|uniref:TUG ubiquitin-like domain-containing protein n=1 Tax=Thyridium curvatum TaxID=1093900 RepID=A0A507BBM7_9PEZI|nr:uncharacterized protein E0L32_003587 [Thyridium curvatum]TPX16646.1 hypothetical protein E0L32_003587 [Thyridium curvatum]
MASHVVVIATDLRRATVKVTPVTYMIDVLDEACKKLNLSSDKYLLKHQNKQLNLADPFRIAGLSPGAKLDLIVKSNSPSVVTVALKLPESESRLGIPNGRVTEKVRSDTSLWKLLRQFESTGAGAQKGLNITARGIPQTSNGAGSGSGQLFWETPVLQVIGREFSTLADFQKNLSQIGINSGNHLMQLSFKRTETPLHVAMQEVERYFKDVTDAKSAAPAAAPVADSTGGLKADTGAQSAAIVTATSSAAAVPEQTQAIPAANRSEQAQPTDAVPVAALDGSSAIPAATSTPADPLQPTAVFSPSSSSTPAAARIQDPDSSFVPSIAHAKLHQHHLLQRTQNKRLKSDHELEADAAVREAKLAAIKDIRVKVRYPDGYQTQWIYGHGATGATLYQAVRSVMRHADQPFKLSLPAGGPVIDDGPKHLIKGYGLRDTMVNCTWADSVPATVRKEPFLKQTVTKAAQEVKMPELPNVESDDEEEQPAKAPPVKKGGDDDGDKKGKKLPKWLKLPGKK